jgi:hypothetical protein
MSWFSSKISVTFIDDATGSVIGSVAMPPADLPESFRSQTTLHLGDVDWSVIRATPDTRSGYSKSGKLTLHLRRVVKIDPREILYSLPSICDRIPPLGTRSLSGDEYVLHEDDWRQMELVSQQFAQVADSEIQSIRQIHEHQAAGIGWRSVHVRRGPETPIAGRLTLPDIEMIFGLQNSFGGVTYTGASSRIESGYSFTAADGQQFYGLAPEGKVAVFAIACRKLSQTPLGSIESVKTLAYEFNLDLVRWCRCERAGNADPLFRKMLAENAS